MEFQELLNKAKAVSKNAYCPYSKFAVGAAVLYESGRVYVGCNVENASYGLSLCAERNAMSSAIANDEKTKVKAIAIYSPNQAMCMPCGACRQWMSEFCINDKETKVVFEDKNQNVVAMELVELFPCGFKFEN